MSIDTAYFFKEIFIKKKKVKLTVPVSWIFMEYICIIPHTPFPQLLWHISY